jgi:LmbE family N-acetylglucosaminyl deacetylase
MSNERVLCIGAHCDDESFGCLGTLLKHKEAGDRVFLLAFASARKTEKGFHKATVYFKDSYSSVLEYDDQEFDKYPLKRFISDIEQELEEVKPSIVYCPWIADLNRDHRIVAEATMVACRPYKEHAPREVWMYEIPGSTNLGLRAFYPDKVVKIDKDLKEKLIRKWYPNELINGREVVKDVERFERWPR